MALPGQTGRHRHCGFYLSLCAFVRLFICYQTCKCNSLKMNEPHLMQIGTIGPSGKGMKRSTLWVRRSGLHEDEDRCGGLVEGSVSTLGSSGFSGSLKVVYRIWFLQVCVFVCVSMCSRAVFELLQVRLGVCVYSRSRQLQSCLARRLILGQHEDDWHCRRLHS